MLLTAPALAEAQRHELGGHLDDAARTYAEVIAAAEASGDTAVLADVTRRLGKVRYRQEGAAAAAELFRRSYDVADAAGHDVLAAQALNALGVLDLERGAYEASRATFNHALWRGGRDPGLRARIEQNLGIIANIQGDWAAALAHYARSVTAFRAAKDEHGCAIACHNLGMLSADRRLWKSADRYFRRSLAGARQTGDIRLRGLCLLNRTEVHIARGRYADALRDAEAALQIFDQLGANANKAGAHRVLGVVYRDTGSMVQAEAQLRTAMALAATVGSALNEADAARELAKLYQELGRNQDALKLFHTAYRLFRRLDARVDLVDVAAKMGELEEAYLLLVRDWGQSMESADSYTHGHCERVATYAVAVAGSLGLDEEECTTIRLGAYLHDVGKVKVPREILNKPGGLTMEEFGVMQQHPIYGVDLLAGVDFPWDIMPMIRWHHEKIDGTGYPDRLSGDDIPLNAQIICIADVYDALTSTRSYRPAMTREDALAEMRACRTWWRPEVFDAFLSSVP